MHLSSGMGGPGGSPGGRSLGARGLSLDGFGSGGGLGPGGGTGSVGGMGDTGLGMGMGIGAAGVKSPISAMGGLPYSYGQPPLGPSPPQPPPPQQPQQLSQSQPQPLPQPATQPQPHPNFLTGPSALGSGLPLPGRDPPHLLLCCCLTSSLREAWERTGQTRR